MKAFAQTAECYSKAMEKQRTHILSNSANLLGICFLVSTLVRSAQPVAFIHLSDLTALGTFFFAVSCFLSFIAMRARNEVRADRYETVADLLFFGGLTALTITVALLSWTTIR